MSLETLLPKTLVDLIYTFNPEHRDEMYTSLVEIVLKNCCHLCRARCDQNENCIKPTSVVFCNNNCMQFWLAQNDYFQNYDAANDFELEDGDEVGVEVEYDPDVAMHDPEQVYDYVDRHELNVGNEPNVGIRDSEQVYDYIDRHGDYKNPK
jgi:hypothetical protein